MPVTYSDDGLPSATDCSCHAVDAGRPEFCQVRLQTSFNSAAARLHASAHSSDVAATFTRNCRRPDQYGLARAGEVGQCELRQDLMLPAPGATSPHAALISAAHTRTTSRCCAIVYDVESNTTAPSSNNSLSHSLSPFVLTN